MTDPNLRERMARALADGWHNPIARWNAEAGLPEHRRPPWDSEAHIWLPMADAALSALLSSPITEDEVEEVAAAINDARLSPRPEPPTDYMHKLARAAIIAYRTVIGRKG